MEKTFLAVSPTEILVMVVFISVVGSGVVVVVIAVNSAVEDTTAVAMEHKIMYDMNWGRKQIFHPEISGMFAI